MEFFPSLTVYVVDKNEILGGETGNMPIKRFPPIGGPEPTGACGVPGCHKVAVAGLLFPPDDAAAAYDNLIEYKLGLDPYVVPCDAASSTLLCNLALESGVINPTALEPCGWPMPKPPHDPLTQDQLNTIVGWIDCGAPEN